jgi:hypothetical protein
LSPFAYLEGLPPEPGLVQFRRRGSTAAVAQARVDLCRHSRVRVPCQRSRPGQRHAGFQRDRHERVTKVMQPDRLEPLAVQPCRVTCRVYGAERVATGLRLAARRS